MAEQVFYEIARWRLDEQLSQVKELNSRLAGVFTAATALLVLFAAFQDFQGIENNIPALALLSAGGIGYVLLVIVTFFGYIDRRLDLSPTLEELRERSTTETEADLRLWAAQELMHAVVGNETRIRAKRQAATYAIAIWAIDVLLLAAAAAVATL